MKAARAKYGILTRFEHMKVHEMSSFSSPKRGEAQPGPKRPRGLPLGEIGCGANPDQMEPQNSSTALARLLDKDQSRMHSPSPVTRFDFASSFFFNGTVVMSSRTVLAMLLCGWLISLPAGLPAFAGSPATQVAQSEPTASNWKPTSDQIREIQVRLEELGFEPGAPDGTIGPRTRGALQGYQHSIGLRTDGKLTKELYESLVTPPKPPAPPEPEQAVAQPPGADQVRCAFANSMWQFEDTSGSRFTLNLREDGSVSGLPYPQHWHWRPVDQGIEITYDNGMGLTVIRKGVPQGSDALQGEATDSRGRNWAWNAKRVALSSTAESSNCKPSGPP